MSYESFLDHMKESAQAWEKNKKLEVHKDQYAGFVATAGLFRETARERDKAKEAMHELFVEFSKGSLRALVLVNTGGIFVIMTIVSAMLSKESSFFVLIPLVAEKAMPFVLGLSCAVATILLAYFSQWSFNTANKTKLGFCVNIGAIVTGLAAFCCFVYGVYELLSVFTSPEMHKIILETSNKSKV